VRFGGQHARQVRRTASAGDNRLQPARFGGFSVFEQQIRGTVGRNNAGFKSNAEVFQHARGVLHDFPVAIAPHHDANLNHRKTRAEMDNQSFYLICANLRLGWWRLFEAIMLRCAHRLIFIFTGARRYHEPSPHCLSPWLSVQPGHH
jgi:hypothetical protein